MTNLEMLISSGQCTGCGFADAAYMTPRTLGLNFNININFEYLQMLDLGLLFACLFSSCSPAQLPSHYNNDGHGSTASDVSTIASEHLVQLQHILLSAGQQRLAVRSRSG